MAHKLPRRWYLCGENETSRREIVRYLNEEGTIPDTDDDELRRAQHGKRVRVRECTLAQRDHLLRSRSETLKFRVYEEVAGDPVLRLWRPMTQNRMLQAVVRRDIRRVQKERSLGQ